MSRRVRLFRPALLMPVALGLTFSVAAILLASNQYTAVDGALRCLQIYWHRPPYLGSNNHLLFPLNVWLWWHLVRVIEPGTRDPIGFLHGIAAMNAVYAGGSVAVVNLLVWRLTQNWGASLLAALVYALSWALLAHATNSAEPMAGLFLSLLALLATTEGLARERLTLVFGGGLCLALALANYESMFLVAALVYSLCWFWPSKGCGSVHVIWLRSPVLKVVASLLGTVLTIVAIYGAAYYRLGMTTPHAMLLAFFRMGGEPAVYAGFRLSKLANLPAGLTANLSAVLPRDYQGLRRLVGQRDLFSIAGLAGVSALVAINLILLAPSLTRLGRNRRSSLSGAFLVGALLVDLLPLVYWDPMYDKLWLQPLALLAIGWGLLASQMDADSAAAYKSLIALIALEAFINLPKIVTAHVEPTRCLEDASRIAGLISPHDKVVTDFDAVSSLWMGLYDAEPARTLVFPATPAAESLPTLNHWTRECAHSGCRIFFIALLDQPKEVWDAFLANRLKVPYRALEQYRQGSRSIDRFGCEYADLRAYDNAKLQTPAALDH